MKIDCDITANYLQEKRKMCAFFCQRCYDCPFGEERKWSIHYCRSVKMKKPGVAIDIVQKWSDENSGPLARWKINSDGYYPYCSDCGFEPERISLYCPNCGKKMINFRNWRKE